MGKIVTLGEVVADVYRERSPSLQRGSAWSRGSSGGWATTSSGTSS
jgi:hypothetical protein